MKCAILRPVAKTGEPQVLFLSAGVRLIECLFFVLIIMFKGDAIEALAAAFENFEDLRGDVRLIVAFFLFLFLDEAKAAERVGLNQSHIDHLRQDGNGPIAIFRM